MTLASYVDLAFRTAFPRARVAVVWDAMYETWIVAVDDRGLHLYAMRVGSDDEACLFRCLSDAKRAPVIFPLPPEF